VGWRLPEEPSGSPGNPSFSQLMMRVIDIVILKFRTAAGADVVIRWRIWQKRETANGALVIHTSVLAHSKVKNPTIPPRRCFL